MKWYLLVIQPALPYWSRFSGYFRSQPSLHMADARRTSLLTVRFSGKFVQFFIALLLLATTSCTTGAKAQAQQGQPVTTDTAYWRVVTERATRIVAALELTNVEKKQRVSTEVATQYVLLNKIHDGSKAVVAGIKADAATTKEAKEEAVKKEEEKKMALLKQQHDAFIAHLQKDLRAAEIEKIKDGLTYSVLPKTYAAHLEMIPSLTEVQKKQIYDWLYEAREYAMDAESSDKKHWWFGKYKGRINNYLSAQGYDLQKEREGWEQRIKEKKANAK